MLCRGKTKLLLLLLLLLFHVNWLPCKVFVVVVVGGGGDLMSKARAGSSILFLVDFFPANFDFSLTPTICPWVSKDGREARSLVLNIGNDGFLGS